MAAGFGYKYLAFLLVFHVLAFQAQTAGLLASQSPENTHKKFLDEVQGENLTEEAQVSSDSGIIQETFSPIVALSSFINGIIGILLSPYSAISGTALPQTFQLLIQGLIGLSEAYVAYLFVRGGA
jgi:hypothetical protein